MDILFTIIAACFIALLLAIAITFGFALLGVLLIMGAGLTVVAVFYEMWRRWRFVKSATSEEKHIQVIDVEYKDITRDDR